MSAITRDQVVDYLSNLTAIQLSELWKELSDRWGMGALWVGDGLDQRVDHRPSRTASSFVASS